MREIRRRTRMVGAFSDGQSALMLVAARLRHVAARALVHAKVSRHDAAGGAPLREKRLKIARNKMWPAVEKLIQML